MVIETFLPTKVPAARDRLRATMYGMRISAVTSTDLFTGTTHRPLQIIRVTLVNDGPGAVTDPHVPVEVRVDGPGVSTPEPARVTGLVPGGTLIAEVPVQFAAPCPAGSLRRVTAAATVTPGPGGAEIRARLGAAASALAIEMSTSDGA